MVQYHSLFEELYLVKNVCEIFDDKIGIHFSEEYFLSVINNILQQMTNIQKQQS